MKDYITITEAIELLKEDTSPYLPEYEIYNIIDKVIHSMNIIGIDVSINDFDFTFLNSTNVLGHCGVGLRRDNSIGYEVGITRYICKQALTDLLINNLYHELCHLAVYKEVVDKGMLVVRNDDLVPQMTDEEILAFRDQNNEGHGTYWQKYVDRVNNIIEPTIEVTAHPEKSIFDYYISINSENIKFTVYCEDCGNSGSFLSYDFAEDIKVGLLSYLIECQDQDKKNTCCANCTGSLRIKYTDPNAKDKILQEDAKNVFMKFIRGMRG